MPQKLQKPKARSDEGIERIESEALDYESSPPRYDIATYPADFTLQGLHEKWKEGEIKIPEFQRGFVWTQAQASKLIESFLVGLPVPSVFFYTDPQTGKLLVIDGQQRLRTVFYYFEGLFGEEKRGKRPTFRLKLNEESPWFDKTFHELQNTDEVSANRLRNAVLRAFIIKQMDPKDNTSMFHIFERLNTGGTLLNPQEIRNCIYSGSFNRLLREMNSNQEWRALFGKQSVDRRMRDAELILRFLALAHESENYKRPMKDFLSKFMSHNRNASTRKIAEFRNVFEQVVSIVHAALGAKPFHVSAGLNAAIFDGVFVAVSKNPGISKANLKSRYLKLLKEEKFVETITSATTDVETVRERLLIVQEILLSGA